MAKRKEQYALETAFIVSNLKVELQAGTSNTLYATWQWSKGNTDHYGVVWRYYTGQGVWFVGSSEDLKNQSSSQYVRATYSAPSNALRVSCTVQPHSTTYTKGSGDNQYTIPYWRAQATSAYYDFSNLIIPAKPNVPTVTISDRFRLVAEIFNITDPNTSHVEFQVVQDDVKTVKHGITDLATTVARYGWDIDTGHNYKVRARGLRGAPKSGKGYVSPSVSNYKPSEWICSEWSDYSSNVGTVPATPKKIRTHEVETTSSIFLYWVGAKGAEGYTVEYAVSNKYFDRGSDVSSVSVGNFVSAHITGLDYGTWYFRVKATNSQGSSGWSPVYSIVLGATPSAPTTWSETSTAIVGDTLRLYWMHNSEDGSSQKGAEVQACFDGGPWTNVPVEYLATESGVASYASMPTYDSVISELTDDSSATITDNSGNAIQAVKHTLYEEGVTIKWRVRTKGITGTWSPWSVERVITVYAPPTVELIVSDTQGADESIEVLQSFPIYIHGTAAPASQSAIGWVLRIISGESYEAYDDTGTIMVVTAGDELYSEYIPATSNEFTKILTAGDVDLVNETTYTISLEVSMNSGLVAQDSRTIATGWSAENLWPNAEMTVDMNNLCAYIRPYCYDEGEVLMEDVTLAVYRREYDGRYVEIASGLLNTNGTTVTDPHPALDYARYRIVATDTNTGEIGFYDLPAYFVGETGIVIQWDEQWTDFDIPSGDGDMLANSVWSGSMLKLPYNIKISENSDIDTSLVEYIGRSAPVSYYGTQLGISGSWSTDIVADDVDTRYALRRLQIWKGDAYVRAPNGVGYWANVKVSFEKDYQNLLTPVTISVTRVEGGI